MALQTTRPPEAVLGEGVRPGEPRQGGEALGAAARGQEGRGSARRAGRSARLVKAREPRSRRGGIAGAHRARCFLQGLLRRGKLMGKVSWPSAIW